MPCSGRSGLLQSELLLALLAEAGVDRSSVVRVTGPCALHALLWLSRHGFEQAGFLQGEGCPHDGEPEALIAAHACNALDLKRLMPVARLVRPGGALIFQQRMDAFDDAAAADWLLNDAGFAVERRVSGGRRVLTIARRRRLGLRAAA
jgi:hypothetical protein